MSISGLRGTSNESYGSYGDERDHFAGLNGTSVLEAVALRNHDDKLAEALELEEHRSYARFNSDSSSDAAKGIVHEIKEHLLLEGELKGAVAAKSISHATASAVTGFALVKAAAHGLSAWVERVDAHPLVLQRERAQIALVDSLRLPDDFKALQRKEYESGQRMSRHDNSFAEALQKDLRYVRALQVRADLGAKAAFEMKRLGLDEEAFLRGNDSARRGFAKDDAFRMGFEAGKWAVERGGADLAELKKDIEGRAIAPSSTIVQKG